MHCVISSLAFLQDVRKCYLDAGGMFKMITARYKGVGCYLCAFRCRCAEVEDGEIQRGREGERKRVGCIELVGCMGDSCTRRIRNFYGDCFFRIMHCKCDLQNEEIL